MSKYKNINDEIIIDFTVPGYLKSEFEEAERADLEGNEGLYYEVADNIDVVCKNLNADGKITKEQWKKICSRYRM